MKNKMIVSAIALCSISLLAGCSQQLTYEDALQYVRDHYDQENVTNYTTGTMTTTITIDEASGLFADIDEGDLGEPGESSVVPYILSEDDIELYEELGASFSVKGSDFIISYSEEESGEGLSLSSSAEVVFDSVGLPDSSNVSSTMEMTIGEATGVLTYSINIEYDFPLAETSIA